MATQTTQQLVPAQGNLRQKVIGLLQENELPVSDLDEDKSLFALLQNGEVIGTGGLEVFADCAFLRSVSVKRHFQTKGLGKFINQELERIAKEQRVSCLYLLTTTAKGFFSKQGYEVIDRDDAPAAIKNTSEFSFTCSSSATLMRKCI